MSKSNPSSKPKNVVNLYFEKDAFKEALSASLRESIIDYPKLKDVAPSNVLKLVNASLGGNNHLDTIMISAASQNRIHTLTINKEYKTEYVQFVKKILNKSFEKMEIVVAKDSEKDSISIVSGYNPGFKVFVSSFMESPTGKEIASSTMEQEISVYAGQSIQGLESNALFNYKMGLYEAFKGSHDSAIKYYTKASQLEPTNPQYLYQLGITHFITNDHVKAIDYFHKACVIDKNNEGFYRQIGKFYEGKSADFIKNVTSKIISIFDRDNSPFQNLLGDYYFANEEYITAVNHYKKAIDFNVTLKKFQSVEEIRVKVLKSIERLDITVQGDHINEFLQFIKQIFSPLIDSKDPNIAVSAGEIIVDVTLDRSNIDKKISLHTYLKLDTVKSLNKILKADPTNAYGLNIEVYRALADTYTKKKDFETANKYYQKATSHSINEKSLKVEEIKGLKSSYESEGLVRKNSLSINLPDAFNKPISMLESPHGSPPSSAHNSPRNSLSSLSDSEVEGLSAHATPRNSISLENGKSIAFDYETSAMSPHVYRGSALNPRHSSLDESLGYKPVYIHSSPMSVSRHTQSFDDGARKSTSGYHYSPSVSRNGSKNDNFEHKSNLPHSSPMSASRSGLSSAIEKSIREQFTDAMIKQNAYTSPPVTPRSKASTTTTPEKLKFKHDFEALATPRSSKFDSEAQLFAHTPASTTQSTTHVSDITPRSSISTPSTSRSSIHSKKDDSSTTHEVSISPRQSIASINEHTPQNETPKQSQTPSSILRKAVNVLNYKAKHSSEPKSESLQLPQLPLNSTKSQTSPKIFITPPSTPKSKSKVLPTIKNDHDNGLPDADLLPQMDGNPFDSSVLGSNSHSDN